MGETVELGELIYRIKAQGGKLAKEEIKGVGDEFEEVVEDAERNTEKTEKLLELWGVAFKAVGTVALAAFAGILLTSPLVQANLKTTLGLVGAISSLLFIEAGGQTFFTELNESLVDFIEIHSREGFVTAMANLLALAALGTINTIIQINTAGGGPILSEEDFDEAIDSLVETAKEGRTAVKSWFEELQNDMKNIWSTIGTDIDEKWESIKTTLTDKAQSARDGVSNIFTSLWRSLGDKWESIKTAAETAWEEIETSISTIAESIKTAVLEKFAAIESAFDALKEKFLGGLSGALSGGLTDQPPPSAPGPQLVGGGNITSGGVDLRTGLPIGGTSVNLTPAAVERSFISSPGQDQNINISLNLDGDEIAKTTTKIQAGNIRSQGG